MRCGRWRRDIPRSTRRSTLTGKARVAPRARALEVTARIRSCRCFLAEQFPEYRVDIGHAGDHAHCEMGIVGRYACVFLPQALLAFGHLDVGKVAHQWQQAGVQQFPAFGRVLSPIVAVRGLGPVDVPFAGRIARADDILHQDQGARYDGAAGFGGMEEVVLVDFVGLGVVADEDHLGVFVVAGQEEVEQDEEALGDVLACFVHRARDIHDAEHDRLADRLWNAHAVAISQVDRINVRNRAQASGEMLDLCFEPGDFARKGFRFAFRISKVGTKFCEAAPMLGAQGDAPSKCAPHGPQHVDVVGRAVSGEAGAPELVLRGFGKLGPDQIG